MDKVGLWKLVCTVTTGLLDMVLTDDVTCIYVKYMEIKSPHPTLYTYGNKYNDPNKS